MLCALPSSPLHLYLAPPPFSHSPRFKMYHCATLKPGGPFFTSASLSLPPTLLFLKPYSSPLCLFTPSPPNHLSQPFYLPVCSSTFPPLVKNKPVCGLAERAMGLGSTVEPLTPENAPRTPIK